jgi:hypothetical protein
MTWQGALDTVTRAEARRPGATCAGPPGAPPAKRGCAIYQQKNQSEAERGGSAVTYASLQQNLAAAVRDHVVPGREIHLRHLRGHEFCEVSLITGASNDNATANIWNTAGVRRPEPEQLEELSADAIAREHGALDAVIGPLRSWTFDRLDIWEAGDTETFGNITGTWIGAAEAAALMQATVRSSYQPAYVYRNTTVTYAKGTQVYVLDAPDGEVFVMESFTRHGDPALSEDLLAHLGGKLDFPVGWGFRAELLDRDLAVSTAQHGNLAHIVQDNLHNTYQGSDVARAFSELCRKDSLW